MAIRPKGQYRQLVEVVAGLRAVFLEASPADEAAGQRDERVVEFGSSFPADSEALELVEQGEGLLDDVTELVAECEST
ncbi:hypothetical protein [Streptomyces sp. NPDC001975]